MRTTTTLAAAFVLLVAPAATVAAQDQGYQATVEDDRATIEQQRRVAGQDVASSVVFDTGEGALAGEADVPGAAELRLNVTLHQLVEYRDAEDDGYDEDAEVLSAYRVANASANATAPSNGTLQWSPLEERTIESEDGTEGTLITGEATFPPADPVEGVLGEVAPMENRTFRVHLAVFDEPVTYEDRELGALEVAVATDVENYPYRSNDTRVALVADAQGTPTPTVDVDEAHRVVAERDAEVVRAGVHHDWAGNATVDDEPAPVDATLVPLEEPEDVDEGLALAYDRGDRVQHAATFGASVASIDGSEVAEAAEDAADAVPGPALLAGLAAIGAAALFARRVDR
jgi:hypothetical protein